MLESRAYDPSFITVDNEEFQFEEVRSTIKGPFVESNNKKQGKISKKMFI